MDFPIFGWVDDCGFLVNMLHAFLGEGGSPQYQPTVFFIKKWVLLLIGLSEHSQ
jgi:hypothetical protein